MTSTYRPHWEHFAHQADIGVRGFGNTIEEAFTQAAHALVAVVSTAKVNDEEKFSITCQAPDTELLLVEWLNQLTYLISTRKMLFNSFNLSIDGEQLSADISGEIMDKGRHQPVVEVKAATYSELNVYQDQSGQWVAQCIVDV